MPTPKPTPLPTPSSPDSRSRTSNDGQGGGAGSPVLSPNNLDEENDDDGAHAYGVVEELPPSLRQSISSFEGIEGKRIEREVMIKLGKTTRTNGLMRCPVGLRRKLLNEVNAAIV